VTHTRPLFRLVLAAALCVALAVPAGLTLATRAEAAAPLTIDIYGPGQSKLKVALAQPLYGPDANATAPVEAVDLQKHLVHNLDYLPFIERIAGGTILGGDRLDAFSGPDVDFRRFQLADADLLVTTGWFPAKEAGSWTVELRVFQAFTGKLLVGKAYYDITGPQIPRLADKFCAAFMEKLTGHGEFFLATLAFSKRLGPRDKERNIWTVGATGRDLTQVTDLKGLSMSPSWSNDGRYIIFTHLGARYHSLGVWDRATRQTHQIKFPGNTIIGPTFTPENKVAVSLASRGNPDIYLLNHIFRKEQVLVQNWAIDVSPSFSHDGTRMAFTSSRLGNPHIFLKDFTTGEEKRVTFNGNYNTDPDLSPDGTLVAFARRTSEGHRIFVMDLKSGRERQVTFGPGNDEQPAFAPDGYFLAFTSNRSGKYELYLTTRHGDTPKEVPTGPGEANFPAWGMVPGQ
jgi:TolB protein